MVLVLMIFVTDDDHRRRFEVICSHDRRKFDESIAATFAAMDSWK